jgi:copper-binding protein NosD
MRKLPLPLSLAMLGTFLVPVLDAAPAHGQATGTWVSGVGDDVNPCSRTAPCKTFAGAISKTAINGEIRCLDPGGFGAVTITKSITIDCHEIPAFLLASGISCIIINITSPTDALQTVRLRNLNCNGAGNGTRSGIIGVNIFAAKAVFIDDMRIDGFTQQGVRDARTTAAGKLYIRNSIIRDNTGPGVGVAGTGSPQVNAVIEDSHINGNGAGVAVGANNAVMVARSVITGNATGVAADPNAVISVDNSTISSNGTGVASNAGAVIRLSNNNIGFNGTGISGATTSFGNNRIYPVVGTAPTPAGADSHDKGQQ